MEPMKRTEQSEGGEPRCTPLDLQKKCSFYQPEEDELEALVEVKEGLRPLRECPDCGLGMPDSHICKAAWARDLVNRQAEDAGLWFVARTASEAYLQQQLRKLHAAIEGEAR